MFAASSKPSSLLAACLTIVKQPFEFAFTLWTLAHIAFEMAVWTTSFFIAYYMPWSPAAIAPLPNGSRPGHRRSLSDDLFNGAYKHMPTAVLNVHLSLTVWVERIVRFVFVATLAAVVLRFTSVGPVALHAFEVAKVMLPIVVSRIQEAAETTVGFATETALPLASEWLAMASTKCQAAWAAFSPVALYFLRSLASLIVEMLFLTAMGCRQAVSYLYTAVPRAARSVYQFHTSDPGTFDLFDHLPYKWAQLIHVVAVSSVMIAIGKAAE